MSNRDGLGGCEPRISGTAFTSTLAHHVEDHGIKEPRVVRHAWEPRSQHFVNKVGAR